MTITDDKTLSDLQGDVIDSRDLIAAMDYWSGEVDNLQETIDDLNDDTSAEKPTKELLDELEEAKNFIHKKIVEILLPNNLRTNKKLLENALSKIDKGDTIITFNYDLLLEQGLLKRGLWNPKDGYCIGEVKEDELDIIANLDKSDVRVLKMHGSISWESPSWHDSNLRILLKDPYNDLPFFDEIDTPKNDVEKKYTSYQSHHVILPTFMKFYRHKWEIELVKLAANALSKTEEVYIVGYSLPEADAMANFLFSSIKQDIVIKIINPNAGELRERLVRIFGLSRSKIIDESSKLEVWLENDCKYIEHEKTLKNEEMINRMIEEMDN
ncbi:MAG: SIR2 family protein [Candidatus Marinimicrobia bacterium]|nr:SIR2 family protein [Candidatus Neomarinimicrobiota bacterium]